MISTSSTGVPPQGLLDLPGHDLAGAVLESWDSFISLVDGADLAADTRLQGWTVRDIVVHLGTWEGHSALSLAIDGLGSSVVSEPADPDEFNAAVIAAHADASDDDVRAALRASREASAAFFESEDATSRGRDTVSSVLGPIPLLTLVHSGCYELAVHALDVAEAIDDHTQLNPALLAHGVAALADSVGGLASRSGIATTVQILESGAGWSFTSTQEAGWTLERVTARADGPAVSGRAADLLEASSGRADAPLLLARRRIQVSDPSGLLVLTPIIDQVPGLAGARALKLAARSLNGVHSAVGSILGHLTRRS